MRADMSHAPDMLPATKTKWIAGLEYEIAGMLTGASWDPTDDGDAECIDAAQALVNDWCKAVDA